MIRGQFETDIWRLRTVIEAVTQEDQRRYCANALTRLELWMYRYADLLDAACNKDEQAAIRVIQMEELDRSHPSSSAE